jgi:hypothetical protein
MGEWEKEREREREMRMATSNIKVGKRVGMTL